MNFNRPQTLENGKFYLLRENSMIKIPHGPSVVRFSSYTASPAFVIVQDKSGEKMRCPRDNLFDLMNQASKLSSNRTANFLNCLYSIPDSFGTVLSILKNSIIGKTLITSKSYFKQILL